jgi:nitrate/TMAO reductase-like tetraheme cytochrome c subunit
MTSSGRRRWASLAVVGLLAAGGLAGLLVAGGGAVAVHHTNTTEFCTSCHVYEQFAADFQESSHWTNAAGVQVDCADCHIPDDDLADMLWTKATSGAQAFWAYYVQGVDTPEAFAEVRPALQEEAHAWFKARDSATCRSCHGVDTMRLDQQSAAARASHQSLQAGGSTSTCVDCHAGVPHGRADGG